MADAQPWECRLVCYLAAIVWAIELTERSGRFPAQHGAAGLPLIALHRASTSGAPTRPPTATSPGIQYNSRTHPANANLIPPSALCPTRGCPCPGMTLMTSDHRITLMMTESASTTGITQSRVRGVRGNDQDRRLRLRDGTVLRDDEVEVQ